MSTLRLAELDRDNLDGALKLALKPGQERFVAPVATSIAEAYVTPTAWPRLALDREQVVGFVMATSIPMSRSTSSGAASGGSTSQLLRRAGVSAGSS